MVNPTPSSSVTYRWNTDGCYTNVQFTGSNPDCFPRGETTRSVTDDDVNAEDAGTITCTARINGVNYTSEPFTLRIAGKQLVYYMYFVSLLLLLLQPSTAIANQSLGKSVCTYLNYNDTTMYL